MKTEERIQKALITLHKAVVAYYKEHPEALQDKTEEIACYGSAIVGIRDFGDGKGDVGIASVTVCTAEGSYYDIEAPIHHKRIKIRGLK